MKRVKDNQTLDMFLVPQPERLVAGSCDYAFEVSHLVSTVLKECPLDRWEISAHMSRLSGRDVSKNMLDAWSSPARIDHNLPLFHVPLLEDAASTHAFTNWLVAKRGGRVEFGEDALRAELGKLELMEGEIREQKRQLKRYMGRKR